MCEMVSPMIMQPWCNLTSDDEWKISGYYHPLNFVEEVCPCSGSSVCLVCWSPSNSQRDDSRSYFRADLELVVVVMSLKSNIS